MKNEKENGMILVSFNSQNESIKIACEPIKIYIDKEYFRSEFKKVFMKWDYKLANGMDMYDEVKFLDDLINTL